MPTSWLTLQGERWIPAKKRRQMLLLMRQLTKARSCHNSQVLAMRQRKRDLVMQLNAMRARLAEADKLLGATGVHCQTAVCHSTAYGQM